MADNNNNTSNQRKQKIDRDALLGTWEYIPTWKIPHVAHGESTIAKITTNKAAPVYTIDTTMNIGVSKAWSMSVTIGKAEIDEYGSYQCPNTAGRHDLALIIIDDDENGNVEVRLQMTEYAAGRPISTLWKKLETK